MKRWNMVCAILATSLLLGACSNSSEETEKKVEDTAEKVKNKTEDAVDEGKKTLEDMMQYLSNGNESIGQEEAITDIPFAAYDGRSFQYNGETVYLYRINLDDADMKRLTQQLQEDSIVNVERNGQKMQYKGALYEDYLLLYDPKTDASSLIDQIQQYDHAQ